MTKAARYLVLLAVMLAVASFLPLGMYAQSGNQAALVVRYADDDVRTICVQYDEPQITGYELLQRSGLDLEIGVQGLGALVCSVADTGCPASDCLCQCKGGGECVYWSYWHRVQENWEYAQGGANAYRVEPGAVEGWSWGPGAVNQASPPPDITFDDVCRSPESTLPPSASMAIEADGSLLSPTFDQDGGEQGSLLQTSGDKPQVDWLPYLFFLWIVLVLVGLLWFVTVRRRSR